MTIQFAQGVLFQLCTRLADDPLNLQPNSNNNILAIVEEVLVEFGLNGDFLDALERGFIYEVVDQKKFAFAVLKYNINFHVVDE